MVIHITVLNDNHIQVYVRAEDEEKDITGDMMEDVFYPDGLFYYGETEYLTFDELKKHGDGPLILT